MRKESAPPDAAIAAAAANQHGVVTVRQLRDAGLSGAGVTRRIKAGRLHRVHRGVYAVGHAVLSREGRWMAAALAHGEKAVVSHTSAASLWRLLPERRPTFGDAASPVDVSLLSGEIRADASARRGGRAKREGIRLHQPRRLQRGETTRRAGIPVTTPERTLRDLGQMAPTGVVRQATRQAEFLGLLRDPSAGDGTRSELEALFLRLCRRNRLPAPEVNVRVGPWTVDFLWREQRLAVETDGYRYHRGRQAFEDDHERDLCLRRRGLDTIRLTYRQVLDGERAVVETLRESLR